VALLWPSYSFVLILKPLDPRSAVAPFFSCAKAMTAAERTICGDRRLAGWDRSAAAAYKAASDNADDSGQVLAEHGAYIKRREGCGNDKICILGEMQTYTLNATH
jgi:uncharacterized protein